MRQRVVIALALCAEPRLVIADEPTTALDVSIQAQIITLLKRLTREHGTAVMLVTHDMGVIAETADRVAVMYAGRIVEIGPVAEVIKHPAHPYTEGLMGSIPSLEQRVERLRQIDGAMPRLNAIPPGCAFNPRCPKVFDRCHGERPELLDAGVTRAACWLHADRAARLRARRTCLKRRSPCRCRQCADAGGIRRHAPLRRVAAMAAAGPRTRTATDLARGGRRVVRHSARHDVVAGRRIRLRQVHRRAPGRRPLRTKRRRDPLRGPAAVVRPRAAANCAGG